MIDALFRALFPVYALPSGVLFFGPPTDNGKSLLFNAKGGGGGTPNIAPPPAAPVVNLPAPPAPPPPPPAPQLADAVDVAKAQQQSIQQSGKDFGFQASLLGNNGNDPAQRPQTIGSLLGNGRATPPPAR